MKMLKGCLCTVIVMGMLMMTGGLLFASETESIQGTDLKTVSEEILMRGSYNYGFVNGVQINGSILLSGSYMKAITSVSTGNHSIQCRSVVVVSGGSAGDSQWQAGSATASVYSGSLTSGTGEHYARSSNDSTYFTTNR